ncbi:MAG: terminase family protein [Clostridia bacterium]|nr:terminase family protein [Clostridia bacterium]
MTRSKSKDYNPHRGQKAFHYAIDHVKRFVAMVCGIRGGKTYSGARQALRMAWNAKNDGVFGIIAPTYKMLKRTTWLEFKKAARPWILNENRSDHIITLKNGRQVFGFTAEDPNSIRNVTLNGFWADEAREAKNFGELWDVLLGRVLSTGGKGIVTTSPNGFDDIYRIFVEERDKDYLMLSFPTYINNYISAEAIDDLKRKYDEKFAKQEIYGEFVVFEGQVYYTFNRHENAGDLAFQIARYDDEKPICLCCDFNVDPMAWVLAQVHTRLDGLKEVRVIDEIFLRNSNTPEACKEFKTRYPNHEAGVVLYGDETGNQRSSISNITNWKIIETELARYGVQKRVPTHNPPERDRINAVNGMICNSKGERRVFVNPNCKNIIRDLEQVAYKEGSAQIDKSSGKDKMLTHSSDAFGYMIEKEFSLNRGEIRGLSI